LKDYVPLGQGSGSEVVITLPPELSEQRITSLRIARRAAPAPVEIFAAVDASKLQANGGHAYYYPLAGILPKADGGGSPAQPNLLLLEDGKPLPLPDSSHDDIRALGKGRYSFWDEKLLFSSSNGSDPRRNGKQYALGKEAADSVNVSIDFNSPAVRL
jgi:hypothetical protein